MNYEKELRDKEWFFRHVLFPDMGEEVLENKVKFTKARAYGGGLQSQSPLVDVLLAAEIGKKNVCLISQEGLWFFMKAKERTDEAVFIVLEAYLDFRGKEEEERTLRKSMVRASLLQRTQKIFEDLIGTIVTVLIGRMRWRWSTGSKAGKGNKKVISSLS